MLLLLPSNAVEDVTYVVFCTDACMYDVVNQWQFTPSIVFSNLMDQSDQSGPIREAILLVKGNAALFLNRLPNHPSPLIDGSE